MIMGRFWVTTPKISKQSDIPSVKSRGLEMKRDRRIMMLQVLQVH